MKKHVYFLILASALMPLGCHSKDDGAPKPGAYALFQASTDLLEVPIKVDETNGTIEVLADSENQLVPTDNASDEEKTALAEGCHYKIDQGTYKFTGVNNSINAVTGIPDLHVEDQATNVTVSDGVGSAKLSTSNGVDVFMLHMLFDANALTISCSYSKN